MIFINTLVIHVFYYVQIEQRAWRKKQLCYKLSRRNICHAVVTDMILLNKSRKAPEGFHLLG